ncbi:hypothetical protein AAHN97_11465 [Chitinophaga niabensis]|uniref:hypothetical protein n=1 Tax=Chitinophaga niabensis TaxID=536979 RepID=UPI0031B9C74D
MRYIGVWITPEPKIRVVKDGSASIRLSESTKEELKRWNDRAFVLPPDDFSFRNIALDKEANLTADMAPKAKVMDFMYFSPYLLATNIIISQRAADFLAGYKMMACELVPVTLYNNGEDVPGRFYFWVNHKIRPELFDFGHAVIRSGTKGLGFQYHEVKDVTAYWQLIKEVRYTTFIKTKLKAPATPPDCMCILGSDIFVTEKFWHDYQKAGLIGLELIREELELVE